VLIGLEKCEGKRDESVHYREWWVREKNECAKVLRVNGEGAACDAVTLHVHSKT